MSEVKHTPGPWSWEHNSASRPNSAAIDIRVHEVEYRGGVCSLYSAEHIGGISFKEAEANARLIAASPDLLEALEGVIATLEDDLDEAKDHADEEWIRYASQRLNKASAAIAKARGK